MVLIDAAVAAKETPTGAQTKATTAQTNAQSYADTKVTAVVADYVRQPGYGVDTRTANHLIVTLCPVPSSYVDGMGVAVKVKVASNAASDININGLGVKPIYDSLGNAVTNFRANTTYSLKYESISGSFIAQGKGGGGNVTAPQLLLGVTATSDTGPITGTMPNNGAVAMTPTGSPQTIALGYHNGSGGVAGVTVPAANVLMGTTIAGTAGTMVNRGAVAITQKERLFLNGIFKNNKFITGERYEYYSNGNIYCTITYENEFVVKKQLMNPKGDQILEKCSYENRKASGYKD